jgi:phage tail-like protein
MPVRREDPYSGYHFEVSITGVATEGKAVNASFSEVTGLEVAIDPIDYRTGSEENRMRKIQGLKKFTNITLKRGTTADLEFWMWVVDGMNGLARRTQGTITLLNENKEPVLVWKFKRGWPCKWTGPGLNAKNNEIAMDSLEICHEGLAIDGDGQPG